jgi:hypothetical protein
MILDCRSRPEDWDSFAMTYVYPLKCGLNQKNNENSDYIKIIDQKVLVDLTNAWFKSFVKFVVDIQTGQLAVGGELNSDAELLLLQNGAE